MKTVKKAVTQEGRDIELIEISDIDYDKTVLIIGAVHGDEPQGKFLIENFLASLRGAQQRSNPKNRLLFIPCLNPDGVAKSTRQNASEIDINRNFPTKNWHREPFASEYFGGEAPSSEVETKFVKEILADYKLDAILTFHSPFKVVNYDGPAHDLAEKIAEFIGYPVQSDIGYPTPGSFGTYAGIERNIPTITLELDEEVDVNTLIEPANKIFDYLANKY